MAGGARVESGVVCTRSGVEVPRLIGWLLSTALTTRYMFQLLTRHETSIHVGKYCGAFKYHRQ